LQQDGQLPPERRGWAMRTWNAAGQHDRTTGIAEAALRKAALPVEELEALERAYRASGRRGDAERAAATLQLQRAAAQPPTPPRGGGFF